MDPAAQSRISRIRGWLLVVLGLGLSLGMTVLATFLAWTIAYNDLPSRTHWTGSHQMTVKVFELFGTIFVFGLVAVGAGILQLRRGRPNWIAFAILLGLMVVMFFIGQAIMRLPG